MSFNPSGLGNLRPETQALHAGQVPDPTTNARAVPIYATTCYVFDDAAHAARLFGLQEFGNIYTRIMNPTTDVFEERVAALEGGVAALGPRVRPGGRDAGDPQPRPRRPEHRLAAPASTAAPTTCSTTRCPSSGITVKFVDGSDPAELRRRHRRQHPRSSTSRRSATRAWTSPTSAASRTSPTPHGVPLIVDNTFAPLLAQPLEHGADIVIHSRHQVDRRPRHRHRRRRRGRRHVRLGGQPALQGGLRRSGPVLPRRQLHRRRSARWRSSSSSASRACATSAPRSARSTPGS